MRQAVREHQASRVHHSVRVVPERLTLAASESELQEMYETERHLLYVACTRERESFLFPASHRFLSSSQNSLASRPERKS